MKKSFISLFLFSLFLTVFGSLSVKADPVATLSFVYDSAGNDKDCNGNDIEAGKGAVGGDFRWSGKIEDAIQKSGDWMGVNNNTTACSRSTSRVHLDAAGDYTFTMDVKWTEGGTRNLPRITITGQSEKTPDIGSSYTFTNNETKTLVYTFNGLAAGYYDISVYFEHGERTKQFVKNLVIASSAPATPTPCSSSLTIEVEGNYAASGDYSGVTYPSNILFKEKNPSGSEYRQGCHGTGYVSFEASTSAEILIPVNIPVSGTYKVKAYAGRNKSMYINIYATTSTDQSSITYKSTTYYKQTYKNINGSHESDSFVESEYTDAVALQTGICLIGLYAEWSHSAWDQITITRTDGTAFCPNNITMAKSGDDGADAPTASPANAAMAGTVVTITAGEASANHYFSGWTVSPENAVTFADQTNATTTFVMPEADVTITANYTTCTQRTVTLAADNVERGSVSGGGDYCEGASVTVTATPETSYRFVNWTYTSTGAEASTDAVYTFTLLENISLTANFEVDPCTNTKTIQCEDYVEYNTKPSGSGDNKPENLKSKDYTGYGNPIGGYYADFDNSTGEMWIPVTLPAGTFTFTVRYVKGGDNMWFNLYDVANSSKIGNSKKLANKGNSWDTDESNSYILSGGDYVIGIFGNDNYTGLDQITITATSNVFCLTDYEISLVNTEGGSAAPTAEVNSSAVTSAESGTTVTVTAAEANSGYYFSGWTVSPENAVTFDDPASPTTTFVMPEADVTITANYGEVVSSALTFIAGEGGSITSATAGDNDISSGGAVVSGTSVTLTAEANSNYVFINWTDNNNSDAVVSTNAAFTFSMPATATAYTANFAQVDNKIITGTSAKVIESNGTATLTVTSVSDFDAFNHNVLKFAYSDMDSKYKGQKVAIDEGYSSASSAGATGFGFYYKTEKADDHVAFCFEVSSGQQVKWELQATNNVWKYYYFAHPEAADWNHSGIFIYMNGDDGDNHTAYKDGGAFYMSEIAATSIISKPDINSYIYTREKDFNSYGTLCLPMAGSVSGATLYSVAGKQVEGGKLYIVLEEQGDALEAGEPYIFETDGSPLTATMSGPHSDVKADANGLVGTYQQITAPAYNGSDDLNYVLALDNSNNTVFKKVGEEVTVGAYRAYLNIHNASDYSPASAAPGRKYIRFGIEGTEEEQAVEMIYDDASLRTRKIMQNGHLYILRDGHLFTAQGTQIK